MSRPNPSEYPIDASEGRSVAVAIRESIAQFFHHEPHQTVETPVTDHTLRDIGVDPTIYENL